jgi:adenylate kinase family enzyme
MSSVSNEEYRKFVEKNDKLGYFCHKLDERVRNDYDAVLGVAGYEGEGKSTFSVQIAAKACGASLQDVIRKGTIYTSDYTELEDRITRIDFPAVHVDEAIKFLYKLNWQKEAVIYLSTLFAVCRKHNKIVILNIPRFRDLTEYMRNHRVYLWVEIPVRGQAIVFTKNRSCFSKDPWNLRENDKLMETEFKDRKYSEISPRDYIRFYRQLKTYMAHLEFQDLPPDVREEYQEISKSYTSDIATSAERGLAGRYRNSVKKAVYLFMEEFGMAQKELAEELELPIGTVNRMARELHIRPSDKRAAA